MKVCLAALLAVCPSLVGAQQFGLDSGLKALRTADETKGWEAVGRLDIGDRAFCTGALIRPDLVLTAAHCLFDKETRQPYLARDFVFRAGLRNGSAVATRGVMRVMAHPSYAYHGPESIETTAFDIALVQLDRPIDASAATPYVTAGDPEPGDKVEVVSYAVDRAEAPSLQQSCHVLPHQFGMDVFSCSVNFGSSGAPIFAMKGTRPEIISVVSAKADLSGQQVSLGSRMAGPLADLQAAFDRPAPPKADLAPPPVQVSATDNTPLPQIRPAKPSAGAKFLKP